MNSILIVIPILTLLMFDLGLTLSGSDFKMFIKRPKPVIVGLIGQLIVLPLVAAGICIALRLPAPIVVGIMLIACSPGGSSSNVFSMLAGGDVALSVSLTACSSMITLLTIPIIMGLTTAAVGGYEGGISLPIGNLLVQNVALMLIPILIGMAVRRWAPRAAAAIHNVLKRAAFPLLVLLAGLYFVQQWDVIVAQFTTVGVCVTLLILLSMGCGAAMSRAARLTSRERRTLVIEIGMQNAAQAIALAASPFVFNDASLAAPAIIYALMMNVVLLTYVAILRRRGDFADKK